MPMSGRLLQSLPKSILKMKGHKYMKKSRLILPFLVMAFIASSCGQGDTGDVNGSSITETSGETLTETELSDISEISETSESMQTAASETAETENITEALPEETEETTTAKLTDMSVADVGIAGHIEDFDDVVPMKFTLGKGAEKPEDVPADILNIAVNAYRETDYYRDALEMMKEYYSYDEKGELVVPPEDEMYFVARYDRDFIMETAAPEVDIKAFPAYYYKVGDGHLVVLLTVLPGGLGVWSGTGVAHIPVYINGSGETFILEEACSQDYADCVTLEYEDGSVHAVMDYGHNMGGMQLAVYSFEGGVPKGEIIGWDHFTIYEDMPVLFRYNAAYMNELYFRDSVSGKYCIVKGAAPDEELARAICSDETVLADIPEAWELYENDKLKIFGGRYMTFYWGNGYTYTLDPATGGLTAAETVTLTTYTDELPEGIEFYNIDLS